MPICAGCAGSRSMSGSPATISDLDAVGRATRCGADPTDRDDRHLVLQVTGGPLGPALRRLADAEPVTLGVREPSLEEIFLEYYGDRS